MIVRCPACRKKNRVPAARLHHDGKCGACQAPIPKAAVPLDVDAATFDEVTARADVPVLVDFWAQWCGPCRMAAPAVSEVARTMSGRALVLKVNTEEHPALSQRFGVRGIPHFMVFKGGQPVFEHSGLVGAEQFTTWLS